MKNYNVCIQKLIICTAFAIIALSRNSQVTAETIIYKSSGNQVGMEHGFAISGIDDIDGDNRPDLIIGAPNYANKKGYLSILSGASGKILHGYVGALEKDELGFSVASSQDMDRDNVPDILVGAPHRTSYQVYGAAYAISGKTGKLIVNVRGSYCGPLVCGFGYSVSPFSDYNRDGTVDFLVGIPNSDYPDLANLMATNGSVQIVSGKNGERLTTIHAHAFDAAGYTIARAGDVDGDGLEDFFSGAIGGNDDFKGAVFLFSTANEPSEFKISKTIGINKNDQFGVKAIESIGDFTGDGVTELLGVAQEAPYALITSGLSGKVLAKYNANAATMVSDMNGDKIPDLATAESQASGVKITIIDVTKYNSIYTFTVNTAGSTQDLRIALLGDINADGISEIIVALPKANQARGEVYVISPVTVKTNTPPLPTATPTPTPSGEVDSFEQRVIYKADQILSRLLSVVTSRRFTFSTGESKAKILKADKTFRSLLLRLKKLESERGRILRKRSPNFNRKYLDQIESYYSTAAKRKNGSSSARYFFNVTAIKLNSLLRALSW